MNVSLPGRGSHDLQNLVLDMNGTIALDGKLIDGVADRISRLKSLMQVFLITADTHGGAAGVAETLSVETLILDPGGEPEQKLALIHRLGAAGTVTVGNGANDVLMLRESALGICVLGPEGAATEALLAADVLAPTIQAALDLLLHPQRLVATLRT
jgi:P-type E1-E2 ATPase